MAHVPLYQSDTGRGARRRAGRRRLAIIGFGAATLIMTGTALGAGFGTTPVQQALQVVSGAGSTGQNLMAVLPGVLDGLHGSSASRTSSPVDVASDTFGDTDSRGTSQLSLTTTFVRPSPSTARPAVLAALPSITNLPIVNTPDSSVDPTQSVDSPDGSAADASSADLTPSDDSNQALAASQDDSASASTADSSSDTSDSTPSTPAPLAVQQPPSPSRPNYSNSYFTPINVSAPQAASAPAPSQPVQIASVAPAPPPSQPVGDPVASNPEPLPQPEAVQTVDASAAPQTNVPKTVVARNLKPSDQPFVPPSVAADSQANDSSASDQNQNVGDGAGNGNDNSQSSTDHGNGKSPGNPSHGAVASNQPFTNVSTLQNGGSQANEQSAPSSGVVVSGPTASASFLSSVGGASQVGGQSSGVPAPYSSSVASQQNGNSRDNQNSGPSHQQVASVGNQPFSVNGGHSSPGNVSSGLSAFPTSAGTGPANNGNSQHGSQSDQGNGHGGH